jgi:DNA replication ATP-dependent helicase Dna2
VLDQGLPDFSQLVLDALDQAGDTVVSRERVLPLLLGQARPTLDVARYERALARAEAWSLNEAQCEALAKPTRPTWSTSSRATRHRQDRRAGPPGPAAGRGRRARADTAFTHRAINQALNTLAAFERGMAPLRPRSARSVARRAPMTSMGSRTTRPLSTRR